jgi:SET domain-containing protein
MKKDIPKDKIVSRPKIQVKRSFAGKGIFALEDIKKDTKIIQYIGKYITTAEADAKPNRYIFEIDDKISIDGSPMYNTARYFNHACKSNAYSMLENENRIFIAARKNIKVGEEITFDYGKEYTNMYIKKGSCRCAQCKKVS